METSAAAVARALKEREVSVAIQAIVKGGEEVDTV